MRAPSLAVIQVVVAMLAFACAGADEIRLPADAAGLSAGASSLHAGIMEDHKQSPGTSVCVLHALLWQKSRADAAEDDQSAAQ